MKEKNNNLKTIGLIAIGVIIGAFLVTELLVMIKENIKFLTTDYETIEQANSQKKEPVDTNTTTKENKKDPDSKKEQQKQEKPKEEKNETPKEETKEETEIITTEQEVLAYFETSSLEEAKDKLKNGFTTIVDFIFYDKEIKGYTFDELTTKAKLKIITFALKIDNKIEEYIPDYKNSISEKYQNIKAKAVSKYLEITEQICANHEDTCKFAKEDFQNMKKSFGITWDLIKNLGNIGIDKLKNWYDIFRESE